MKKNVFVILLFWLFTGSVIAQDLHFSQFYNFPLALNPALTGRCVQDYRIGSIYRSQWSSVRSTFNTTAFAGDINFKPQALKGDKIGVGFFLYNDQMGEGVIKNNSAYFSTAYHKTLDNLKRHKISLGVQGGYVRKSIDYSSLFFGNQIIGYEVDLSSASGEKMENNNFSYLNINTGAFWSFQVDQKTEVHSGISFFNVINPKETFAQEFLAQDINKLRNRAQVNVGMAYKISERVSLYPEILFMTQQRAIDLNIGSAIGYHVGESRNTTLLAGTWYRIADAAILMTGIRHKGTSLAVSYDMTTSSFKEIRNAPNINNNARVGAFEITLTHAGFIKRPMPNNYTIPCGIF